MSVLQAWRPHLVSIRNHKVTKALHVLRFQPQPFGYSAKRIRRPSWTSSAIYVAVALLNITYNFVTWRAFTASCIILWAGTRVVLFWRSSLIATSPLREDRAVVNLHERRLSRSLIAMREKLINWGECERTSWNCTARRRHDGHDNSCYLIDTTPELTVVS